MYKSTRFKTSHTPSLLGKTLSQHDGTLLLDPKLYPNIVEAFQYVTLTHLNVAFVVNKACQFMATHTNVHYLAIKIILHYLQGTSSFGLQIHQA